MLHGLASNTNDPSISLPTKYKVAGLKAAYKVGSVVRKAIGKGCNCLKLHDISYAYSHHDPWIKKKT